MRPALPTPHAMTGIGMACLPDFHGNQATPECAETLAVFAAPDQVRGFSTCHPCLEFMDPGSSPG